ncbi:MULTISPECIES: transporter substrate-binding domain-containing protein [unclassified Streptomyces]|uniref:transporter substrate-binding domain-containing protein n=1 Tax=unclassified Streptomyces TaxID=2593676 RepID=UPI00278C10C5|nr:MULTISPECIES: transporter substrate-binding domain-containing protein [unclassified Streptomyces]
MSGSRREGAPIRVGFQRSTPPFSYATAAPDERFEPIGYSVDVARMTLSKVFGGAHATPPWEAVEVTSATREALLAEGRIDIECGSTTITRERLTRCAFSRPIFRTSHRIAVKPGALAAASAVKVVGIRGSTSQAALESSGGVGFPYTFVGVDSIGAARDAFLADPGIGAMVADEVILRSLLGGGETRSGASLLDVRLGGECYGFMMRRRDREFLRAVDAALEQVLTSDEYPEILSAWFVDSLPGLGFGLGMDMGDGTFMNRNSWN